MESCKGSDMNVIDSSVPGTQKGTAAVAATPAPVGKTQTGRSVQCETTAIQAPRPMPVLHAPRRATADHMVTVTSAPSWPDWNIVLTEESKRFELRECYYKPTTDEFLKAVQESLTRLKEKWWAPESRKDPALFCMAVAKQIDQLKNKYRIADESSDNYKFMIWQLAPYYIASLRPALETIKRQIDNECGWEYNMVIGIIGRYMKLQTNEIDIHDNWELLEELYLKLIDSELDYLEFIKACPLAGTAKYSKGVLDRLLSSKYGAKGYCFIDQRGVDQINSRIDSLIQTINHNLANGGIDNNIDNLRKELHRGIADKKIRMQTKRRYNDLLKALFEKEKELYRQQKYASTATCISFLNILSCLFVECTSMISELHVLSHDIMVEMTSVIKVQLGNHLYRGVRLDEEMMNFIEGKLDKEVVSEKCRRFCLCCKELEFPLPAVMKTVVKADEGTGCQFRNKLDEIVFIPGNKREAQKAAGKLRKLFYEYGDEIKALNMECSNMVYIVNLRNRLYKELFIPLIKEFYKYQNQAGVEREKSTETRHSFHSELVALIPYTFFLVDMEERIELANVACAVWYCDVEELSQAVSFREENVDCLLELKHLSPCIPDQSLRAVLEKALVNLFRFVVCNTGEISVEKIAILSQWIDGLNRVKCVDEHLARYNDQWKETNKDAVSKRDSVSPDIPSTSMSMFDIGQTVPEFVAFKGNPETAGVPSDQTLPNTTQFPFRADRSRSTVTMSIKPGARGRTKSRKVNMKAAGPDVWRGWSKGDDRKMAAPAKIKTRVDVFEAAVRTQGQRRVKAKSSSGASWRTLSSGYTMAVKNAPGSPWKTASTGGPGSFKLIKCKYQPAEEFRSEVEGSLKTLEKEREMPGADAWSFCLAVAKETQRLTNKYQLMDTETDLYQFMKFQLGPYYVNSLRPALETVICKVKAGCGWKYYMDIGTVAQYLDFQPYGSSDECQNRALQKEIYLQIIDFELKYMDFISHFPSLGAARRSSNIIECLLNSTIAASGLRLIDKKVASDINPIKDSLMKTIESNLVNGGIDEKRGRLKEEVYRGNTDPLVRRRYSDLLRDKFLELKFECRKQDVGTKEQLSMLERLFDLRVMHTAVVGDLHFLPREIAAVITGTVKERMIKSLESGIRLEQEMLDFIDEMLNRDVVSEECGELCLRCKELEFPPQTEMEITAQTDRMTDDQCRKKIAEIASHPGAAHPGAATGPDFLTETADRLKQLLYQYGHEIKTMDSTGLHTETIKEIKKDLGTGLFRPFVEQLYKHQNEEGMDEPELFAAMSKYRPALARLIPYTFVLDESDKADLMKTVSAAWYCDIERLSMAESFREEDVDCLLGLKRIVPHTPDPHIRITVKQALIKFFQFVDQNGTGKIPVEKIAILSQWVDGLNRVRKVDDQLKTCNEKWKETNNGAVSRDTVPSDIHSSSALLFEQVYSALSQRTLGGHLAATRLLASIDTEQSPQEEDFEIIRDLVGKTVFIVSRKCFVYTGNP